MRTRHHPMISRVAEVGWSSVLNADLRPGAASCCQSGSGCSSNRRKPQSGSERTTQDHSSPPPADPIAWQ